MTPLFFVLDDVRPDVLEAVEALEGRQALILGRVE
jgi:hypothetical protein